MLTNATSVGFPFAGAFRNGTPPWFVPMNRPRIITLSPSARRSSITVLRSGNDCIAPWCAILAPSIPGGSPGIAVALLSKLGAKKPSIAWKSLLDQASSSFRMSSLFSSDILLLLLSSSICDRLLRHGVRARVIAGGRGGEPRQEVVPPVGVLLHLLLGKAPVGQAQERPLAVGNELHLDRARSGRDGIGPLPAPREHDPPRTVHLDKLPPGDRQVVDGHAIRPARTRLERRGPPLPPNHLVRVGEELEHRLGPRRDPDL